MSSNNTTNNTAAGARIPRSEGIIAWSDNCCYYNSLQRFLQEKETSWINTMKSSFSKDYTMPLEESQVRAWKDSFHVLQNELPALEQKHPGFHIVFEYALPYESGRRPDVLLISEEQVIVLEFKQYDQIKNADIDQVGAYARDIQEYHYESRDKRVSPILVLTGTTKISPSTSSFGGITICSKTWLYSAIEIELCDTVTPCDCRKWLHSKYAPLPTIVEAARIFMKKEELPDIRRVNSTSIPQAHQCLKGVTAYAYRNKKHVLALVTGVPGAGKTYLGLQYVYDICDSVNLVNSVYLSGNGPLVKVLTDALNSKVFVKDLHGVINEYTRNGAPDFSSNVIVFDEGQRAWDKNQMLSKRRVSKSEPEIMIELCTKRLDWCVLLLLVGEGQEIYNGENGGLGQWADAINHSETEWKVICPDKLTPTFAACPRIKHANKNDLDLSVSLRSHLASYVSKYINLIIDGKIKKASQLSEDILNEGFNMYVTRDLNQAKKYLRDRYADEPGKKYGLLASSKSEILPKYGMDNSFRATSGYGMNYGKWFNAASSNSGSCCALNQVVTEFGCQGLEIDMPLIGWDNDFVWNGSSWDVKKNASSPIDSAAYRINSYRVLLTRGRDGFVVFVPPTRELDGVYNMLQDAGVRVLQDII